MIEKGTVESNHEHPRSKRGVLPIELVPHAYRTGPWSRTTNIRTQKPAFYQLN
jgi:hypothetical protein